MSVKPNKKPSFALGLILILFCWLPSFSAAAG